VGRGASWRRIHDALDLGQPIEDCQDLGPQRTGPDHQAVLPFDPLGPEPGMQGLPQAAIVCPGPPRRHTRLPTDALKFAHLACHSQLRAIDTHEERPSLHALRTSDGLLESSGDSWIN